MHVIQAVFIVFLVIYGMLIVTNFYHNPFISPGRDYEICIILYIGGLVFEETLQVCLLPLAYFLIDFIYFKIY